MKKVLCLLTLTAVSCLTVFANITVTGLQSRALSCGVFQVHFAVFVKASAVTVMERV
jgi:hypothetical protein